MSVIIRASDLPVREVLWLKQLPKNAALPVGTVQAAQSRFVGGQWDYDYVFYTESDQVRGGC